MDPESSDLFEDMAQRLRGRGLEVGVATGLPEPARGEGAREWDVAVINRNRADVLDQAPVVFGGRAVSRPESLGWLAEAGVPLMEWDTPSSRLAVLGLFRKWGVDRLILKPSWTFGGKDVHVFARRTVARMQWDRELDVICKEVNPNDGDIYKVELIAGKVLVSWMSESPPIREQLPGGYGKGLPGAYGERSLWEPPDQLRDQLCELSARLTDMHFGHISVDLMKKPDGTFVAIELNPRSAAIWWTKQFESFRQNYTDALYELAMSDRT